MGVLPKGGAFALVKPSMDHLSGYVRALELGWSPDNLRNATRFEHLRRIEEDAPAFIASLEDREAKGPPIKLLDGSVAQRLPGFDRWMWDGEFCGRLGFRWQPGTPDLPAHCLGHIGYTVVPWKRRNGYATSALRLLLPEARELGLPYVDLTTEPDNEPSQRVILANGGTLIGRFRAPDHGDKDVLRFRIFL